MVENIPVSGKHIKLRVIIFILSLLVALTAFSYGVISCSRLSDGYYELDRVNEEDNYYGDIRCVYYVQAENNKQHHYLLSKSFTAFIKKANCLLDPLNENVSSNGLWVINNHLGEDVVLEADFYEICKDAYNKTCSSKNYSVFAGPLYAEWDKLISICSLGDYSLDPTNDISEANFIDSLVNYINDSSNFNVVFNDTNKTINVNISEEYKNFRNQNDIDYPVFSFNVLEKAYAISLVSKWLIEQYGNKCYFEAINEGIISNFNEFDKIGFEYVGQDKNSLASFSLNGAGSASIQYKYQTAEFDDYYSFVKNGEEIVRSKSINIKTGYPDNEIQSCICCCKNVIDSTFICNELISYNNVENVPKNYEDLFFLLQDKQQNNYSYNSYDKLVVNSDKVINVLGGN